MENSRKGRNLRSVALFLAMLIITPLLIFGCSCAKTAQNNKERWHNLTTTRWMTTTKTDTIVGDIYTFVTDTVKVKYYVNRYKTKEVEKPASTWHKIRLLAGDCVLLFLAIFAVCWIKERIKKRVQ